VNGAAGDARAAAAGTVVAAPPGRTRRQTWITIAIGVVFGVYPVLVWLGLANQSPRWVAIALLCVMVPVLVYLMRTARGASATLLAPVLTVAAIVAAALFDDATWLFVEPVAISAGLLLLFGPTLRRGAMPMVERFARLQEPDLSPDKQRWCRTWTWIWCTFFVANGTTSALLAAFAPLAWWACWNGSVVYAVMGCLFASEWLLRRRKFYRG
jgi:uncharacterized membrane protein